MCWSTEDHIDNSSFISLLTMGDREMAQQLRAYNTLTVDLSSVASTFTRWFTTACNARSKESGTLFWLLWLSVFKYTSPYAVLHVIRNKRKYLPDVVACAFNPRTPRVETEANVGGSP